MAAHKGGDVVVVGAGIIGAACAFRLAEGGMRTIVIDAASSPATGSTGRSAAGVRVQFSSETNVRLSWESIKEYRAFTELFGESAEYRPIGYMFLVPHQRMARHMAALSVQQRVGVPVQVLTTEEAQRKVVFDPENIAAATFGPADGIIDPHKVTHKYLSLAKERGCQVHLDSPLIRCDRNGEKWRVTTPNAEFECDYIVNAAGPWAGEVGKRAGLQIPVQPVRRMIFATSPSLKATDYPLTVDLDTGFYLRTEGPRILLGRSNPSEPAGFREGMDWAWLDSVLTAAVSRFPWLSEAALDRRASWWGYYEVTPDHNPILGAMHDVPTWVNACGFSGHGVQQAAAVGRVITEEITLGRARSIDIDPFRFERILEIRHESQALEDHIV